jgi:hypothetical protein
LALSCREKGEIREDGEREAPGERHTGKEDGGAGGRPAVPRWRRRAEDGILRRRKARLPEQDGNLFLSLAVRPSGTGRITRNVEGIKPARFRPDGPPLDIKPKYLASIPKAAKQV